MPFALSFLLLSSEPLQAEPEPVYELRWSAPSSCPTQIEVGHRIEEFLAGSSAPGVHVTAEATVEHARDRWVLTLRISTASGSRVRTVEAGACDELASVAALLVAIAVDPGLTAGPPASAVVSNPAPEAPPLGSSAPTEAETSPPAEPEAPPPPKTHIPPEAESRTSPELQPRPPRSADTPSRTLRGSAMARVGLSTGVLPSVAPVVQAGGGLWWRLLGVQVRAVHRLPRRVRDGRAELWTLAGDVRGCAVPRTHAVLFPLCVGVEIGAITGRSFRVSDPGRGRAPWLALHAGGGLTTMVSRRIGITMDAGLVVPVVRAGFEIEGIGELHRVGAVGLDANLGVEIIFP